MNFGKQTSGLCQSFYLIKLIPQVRYIVNSKTYDNATIFKIKKTD